MRTAAFLVMILLLMFYCSICRTNDNEDNGNIHTATRFLSSDSDDQYSSEAANGSTDNDDILYQWKDFLKTNDDHTSLYSFQQRI